MAASPMPYPMRIARVTAIKEIYIGLRGTPGLNVEFAIASMGEAIDHAVRVSAAGDVIQMLLAYESLKGFDV
jgi:hypothetical protein